MIDLIDYAREKKARQGSSKCDNSSFGHAEVISLRFYKPLEKENLNSLYGKQQLRCYYYENAYLSSAELKMICSAAD